MSRLLRQRRLVAVSLSTIGLWVAAAAATADPKTAPSSPTAVRPEPDPMQEVTPEREAAAETFARLHHPELAELLERLKASRPSDYKNAVRDLFRESERLAKLKARDAERYALELEAWKLGSRIQLAAARLAMEDSSELREELYGLLQAKIAVRTQLVELERTKVAGRLERLDADLAELRSDPAARAAEDLEKLLKSAKTRAAQARRQRAAGRPRSDRTSDESAEKRPTEPNRGDADTSQTPSRGRAGKAAVTTE